MYMREDSANVELTNAADLVRRVRLSIDQSRLTGLRLIDIEAIGSTVVLRGQVATFHQIELATASVRKVAGVVDVMNLLELHDDWEADKPQPAIGLYRQNGADQRADR